ncbi:MAG: carboxypeptidase-like regulatory domain-containing protein [Planctomycetota bacterium]
MTRPVLFFLLLLAAGGGLFAVVSLLDEGGPDRTGERDAGVERGYDPKLGEVEQEAAKDETTSVEQGRLSGVVLDRAGRPVPGARLWARSVEATSDESGRFALSLDRGEVTLLTRARGYYVDTRKVTVDGSVTITLDEAPVLFGTVTGASGQPIARAVVYLIEAEYQVLNPGGLQVQTNEKGEYLFHGVPPGLTDVGVKAYGHLPQLKRDLRVREREEHRVDFVLAPGRTVKIRVEGFTGPHTPVVRVFDSRLRNELLPPGGIDLITRTLVGRAFIDKPAWEWIVLPKQALEMSGLPEGPVDLHAGASRNRSLKWVADPILDSLDPEVTLYLYEVEPVTIRAKDAVTGDALEPTITRFVDGDGPRYLHESGAHILLPTSKKRHTLRFELDGYQSLDWDVPEKRESEHVVKLQPLADAPTGKLKLVFDREFQGRVGVLGRGESGGRQFRASRDKDGAWLIEKIPPGRWDFSVLPTGMVPTNLRDVQIVAGSTQELRVALYAGGGIELKVVGPDDKLLDKVTIDLRDADNERIDIHFLTMVSDDRGFTSINFIPSAATARADSGFAAGNYTLYAGRDGYDVGSSEFTVVGTDVASVTVTLQPR